MEQRRVQCDTVVLEHILVAPRESGGHIAADGIRAQEQHLQARRKACNLRAKRGRAVQNPESCIADEHTTSGIVFSNACDLPWMFSFALFDLRCELGRQQVAQTRIEVASHALNF